MMKLRRLASTTTMARRSSSSVAAARALLRLEESDLPPRGARVCVALSGGVDSAVVAWALKQAAYDVSAVHMKNWEASEEDNVPTCTQEADFAHVRHVAERIGIGNVEQVRTTARLALRTFCLM